ncbi:MAG: Integrase core domain protein [Candidatus Scalindua rubra]|uniref:Integrase core domain protein n=1 Tax=Candidatus Scalindua rubra TaxID=1872076 RepID=A0A1E3X1V1_9BACT|nr:MAG: Integrase core domain protein [Candidatus Scalindua rubra]
MYCLTMKDINKYKTVTEVIEGYLKVEEASKILKLSERQIYRIKKRVEREGIKGILHKSRGVNRARWLTQDIQDKAVHLYDTKYKGFNITHVTEYLNTEEKIKISKESLRQILMCRGLHTRSKRRPKHLQWREPRAREGQMIQFDTSDHDWLEGRGPRLYLIGGIDDATSACPGARFALSDSCSENMVVLKQIVETKGIPLSFYCDRDSKFKTTRHEGLHYQLKGDYGQTQIARALNELGVEIVYAYSPQAKGRVERAWGTFQDRLCSELRLHKVSTLQAANRYLTKVFIPKYNRKFARLPREKGSAYRALPKDSDLSNIFCIKEERTVASDNTISYHAKTYQILPGNNRISFVRAKVMVHRHLDGSIHIFLKEQKLRHKQVHKNNQKASLLVGGNMLTVDVV